MSTPALEVSPFSTSPNPTSLYITPSLRAVLTKARFTIQKGQGITLVLGDVGLGKSTVLRFLHSDYDARDDTITTFIPTPDWPSNFSMLKSICMDFGLEGRRSYRSQQEDFQQFLLSNFKEKRNVVLFIDEANLLSNSQLEMLRGWLNFESPTRKLCQIVLSGQLDLRERLKAQQHKPLRSRISTYSLLDPLTHEETRDMLDYRCKWAQIKNPFSPEVVERIYEVTGGVPRAVLKLCALAYEMKVMQGIEQVPIEFIDGAVEEIEL
jgi:type II secretory pathway predicted ATPase ExeA